MSRGRTAVAATGSWVDPDGFRAPAGEVHAWLPGTNQTVCGMQIKKQGLRRFSHIEWADVQPVTGRDADLVTSVCHRCAAGTGHRRGEKRWTRHDPRP
jgi:hypothetical protein